MLISSLIASVELHGAVWLCNTKPRSSSTGPRYTICSPAAPSPPSISMWRNVGEPQIGRTIEDYPHGTVFAVLADVGDGARKVRVLQIRHRDQELVFNDAVSHHTHSIVRTRARQVASIGGEPCCRPGTARFG